MDDWLAKMLEWQSTANMPLATQKFGDWQSKPLAKSWGSDFNQTQANNRFNFKGLTDFRNKEESQNLFKNFSKNDGLLKKGSNLLSNVGGAGFVGNAFGIASSLIPDKTDNPLTAGINKGYDMAANTLMKVPGAGQVVGAAMKANDFLIKGMNAISGGKTTVQNAVTTFDKIANSSFLGSSVGLVNAIGKKAIDGTNTDLASTVNKGYQPGAEVGDAEFGGISRLFSKKDTQRENRVKSINTQNYLKSGAIQASNKRLTGATNSMGDVANKNRQKLSGGLKTNVLAAKKGAKLIEIKNIKEKVKHNVIPSGALHARKNNLPKDIASHVTHKGIPVISKEAGGEIVQHAEIEHSEIIFNKDVTVQLESLLKNYKDGNEKAAIEAGKLLTFEILENTEDNTNNLLI